MTPALRGGWVGILTPCGENRSETKKEKKGIACLSLGGKKTSVNIKTTHDKTLKWPQESKDASPTGGKLHEGNKKKKSFHGPERA